MQERLSEFEQRGAEVVVISFATPARLDQYLKIRPWPFRVLADPERVAYRAFGLERASWAQLLKPGVILTYLGLILRGRRPKAAHEDVHQLGGDFVLDRPGKLLYAYRSSDPADRPDVSELIAAVSGGP